MLMLCHDTGSRLHSVFCTQDSIHTNGHHRKDDKRGTDQILTLCWVRFSGLHLDHNAGLSQSPHGTPTQSIPISVMRTPKQESLGDLPQVTGLGASGDTSPVLLILWFKLSDSQQMLPPTEHSTISRDVFGCYNWGRVSGIL